jgi:addiction module HigA family antidote
LTTTSIDLPIPAIHPGEHLAEEVKPLNMSAAELARQLDIPTNQITQILNGTRAITGDTALRLAHFFGTSAELWLNLQSLYELRLAQEKAGKSIRVIPHAQAARTDPRLPKGCLICRSRC